MSVIAGVLQGALDGAEQMHVRAAVVVVGQVLLVFLSSAMIGRHGLEGLIWAQVGQGAWLVAASWLGASHYLALRISGLRWDRGAFSELLPYAIMVQMSAVLMLLFDPLTKLLLSHFGGLEVVAKFEVASQIVTRVRAVIVAASQAVVPAFARRASNQAEVRRLYRGSLKRVCVAGLVGFLPMLIGGGQVSRMVFGYRDEEFMTTLWLLVVAWFINVLTVPAYFANLAFGEVSWNLLAHGVIAAGNLVVGGLGGLIGGWRGVVVGYSTALVVGSCLAALGFRRRGAEERRKAGG
jgi:O-antigen/teichoic acid export membrane protein